MDGRVTIDDIKGGVPFSQGSTEINLTGHWTSGKPLHLEKTSPCRPACPVGNDIARAFKEASRGNYDEALRIIRQDNPLPGVCGRVCYHPCELRCNRRDFDRAVNIRGFERFLSDHAKIDIDREMRAQPKKERIAVVGSGPAGLSAAWHLARLGYGVSIFEALAEPGGMLRYSIPEYRLPRDVLRKEIELIRQMGVEIRTGVQIGKDLPLAALKADYNALFLAVGTHRGLRLGIRGADLPGVLDGLEFLRKIHRGEKIGLGEKVAVIGGGNTAVDCARTAKRVCGNEVSIIYRRSRSEMPAISEDIAEAEKEGITIGVLAAPKKFAPVGNRIALECIRMQLGEPDETGRARPVPIEGSEYTIEVDTVITAVGQTPETDFAGAFGITVARSGVIEIDAATMATNIEGVFAGGDGAGQKAFVADAIAGGKMGALAIHCYLKGKDIHRERESCRIGEGGSLAFEYLMDPENYPVDLKKVVAYDKINTLCFQHGERIENPEVLGPQKAVESFAETIGGIAPAAMCAEIERCFMCGSCTGCDLCFLLCPDVSVRKSDTGYTIRTDYCKGCGQCAATCPRHVIEMGGNR